MSIFISYFEVYVFYTKKIGQIAHFPVNSFNGNDTDSCKNQLWNVFLILIHVEIREFLLKKLKEP